MHSPYGVFVGVFEKVNPVFGFCIMNHLGVFVAGLAVLFVEEMVKVGCRVAKVQFRTSVRTLNP